jgi:hypothetical protein
MDCGVRVDAGKPLIIAEEHRKNPDKRLQAEPEKEYENPHFRL